jgi:hypothetical protein
VNKNNIGFFLFPFFFFNKSYLIRWHFSNFMLIFLFENFAESRKRQHSINFAKYIGIDMKIGFLCKFLSSSHSHTHTQNLTFSFFRCVSIPAYKVKNRSQEMHFQSGQMVTVGHTSRSFA